MLNNPQLCGTRDTPMAEECTISQMLYLQAPNLTTSTHKDPSEHFLLRLLVQCHHRVSPVTLLWQFSHTQQHNAVGFDLHHPTITHAQINIWKRSECSFDSNYKYCYFRLLVEKINKQYMLHLINFWLM